MAVVCLFSKTVQSLSALGSMRHSLVIMDARNFHYSADVSLRPRTGELSLEAASLTQLVPFDLDYLHHLIPYQF